MNQEEKHYENKDHWKKELFLEDEQQIARFESCTGMIPEDVKSLYDIGAGNGAFLYWLEKKNKGITLKGLERSQTAIANKLCASELLRGNIQELPFSDKSAEMITCMEVIEHLPSDAYEKGLHELERVAQKYILITVPYREYRALVRCPYCGAKFHPWYHMRSFDEEKMQSLFQHFEVENIQLMGKYKGINPNLIKLNYIKKRMLNRETEMPAGCICPQCSYKTANKKENLGKSSSDEMTSPDPGIKQFIMRVCSKDSFRWMAALYHRK